MDDEDYQSVADSFASEQPSTLIASQHCFGKTKCNEESTEVSKLPRKTRHAQTVHIHVHQVLPPIFFKHLGTRLGASCTIIGASLSEPHTSMTALYTCICTKCVLACLPACLG